MKVLLDNTVLSNFALAQRTELHRTSRFFTDDRDARKLAAQLQVPVSGTLGILLRLVQIQALTMEQANALLALMVAKGYRSPVGDLGEL